MRKAEALAHWRNLQEGQDPLPVMRAIPYRAEGSSYGACGVRIDGNPAFVDAVLSCLKGLLAGENTVTRLELSRQPVDGNGFGKTFGKADADAEVCYIRLHERGREARMVAAFTHRPAPAAPAAPAAPEDTGTADRRARDLEDLQAVRAAFAGVTRGLCVDEVTRATRLPVGRVTGALMLLEVQGDVTRIPGGYYQVHGAG